MQNLTMLFPAVFIVLNIGAAVVCAFTGDWKEGVYWLAVAVLNAVLNAAMTFLGGKRMKDIYEPEAADCCANCWYCESGRCCCREAAHYMDYVTDTFVCGCYTTVWQGETETYGR